MAAQDPGENSIGFVGLGDMGGPIAHRIAAAGFPLAVWSRGVHSLEELGEQRYVAVDSLQELGNGCGIVAVCVFSDADVRDVVLGAGGLLAAMSRDSVLVIHSTVSVALCWEIAVAGARRGVHVLDAPVSGARAGAVNGTLTIMVGGDPSLRYWVTPLLKSYGRLIQWMGPVGSGQKMKVLNNVRASPPDKSRALRLRPALPWRSDPACWSPCWSRQRLKLCTAFPGTQHDSRSGVHCSRFHHDRQGHRAFPTGVPSRRIATHGIGAIGS